MLSVSIRQLEYAIAVAKYGSVTVAASQLHVSQPALSVAIRRLEETLDKSIFIRRKGSPLMLSAYGREFIDQSSVLVEQLEVMISPEGSQASNQTVIVGFNEDLAPLITGPILAGVKAQFPRNELIIRSGSFDQLSDDLLQGRIDFALSYNLGLDASFETREVAAIRPHLLLYPEHPLAHAETIALAEVAKHSLVLANQKLSLHHINSIFRERQLIPASVYRAPTFEMMRSLVANGQGLGISYTKPRSTQSYDGKPLLYRWIDDVESAEPILIISNRRNPLSSTAKIYIELIDGLSIWKDEISDTC